MSEFDRMMAERNKVIEPLSDIAPTWGDTTLDNDRISGVSINVNDLLGAEINNRNNIIYKYDEYINSIDTLRKVELDIYYDPTTQKYYREVLDWKENNQLPDLFYKKPSNAALSWIPNESDECYGPFIHINTNIVTNHMQTMVNNNDFDIEFDDLRKNLHKFNIITVRNNAYSDKSTTAMDNALARMIKEREDFDISHKSYLDKKLGLAPIKEDTHTYDADNYYIWDNDKIIKANQSIWTKIGNFIKNYLCCCIGRCGKVKPV
jgi:hypothetical protein